MSLAELCTTAPSKEDRLLSGQLHKSSGPMQLLQPRVVELHPGFLYLYQLATDEPEGVSCSSGRPASTPYGRIPLSNLTIANSQDTPTGFSLVAADGRKVRFVAESLNAKRVWSTELRKEIERATPDSALHGAGAASGGGGGGGSGGGGGRNALHLDRSRPALCEGFLQKRSGVSGYHPRWCEARRGVGIAYGKAKSAADDNFKVLALEGNMVRFTEAKRRIVIATASDTYYFKCATWEDFAVWRDAVLTLLGQRREEEEEEEEEEDVDKDYDHQEAEGGADDASGSGNGSGSRVGRRRGRRSAARAQGTVGVDDDGNEDEEELDGEVLMELADLQSPIPIRGDARLPEHERRERLRSASIPIESVCREFRASKSTTGFDAVIADFLSARLPHELDDMIAKFQDKMFVPISSPFSAVNEHTNLLDLDASKLRQVLNELLDRFGDEEEAFVAIEKIDAVLRLYTCVRERLVIKRDIAQFREQQGKCGLTLGVNGSLQFIAKLIQKERGAPSPHNWERVNKLVNLLRAALGDFREAFDVFEESLDTILDFEEGIALAEHWLNVHRPRGASQPR